MGTAAQIKVLIMLAWRNLFCHKGKNLIVGMLIFLGAFLLVMGTSLLSSVEKTMAQSITSSLAGHLQVYDKDARDELALFGGEFISDSDIGSMPDFSKVKGALLDVPNVKAVVPMGMGTAEFYMTTELDRAIEGLRQALAKSDVERTGAFQAKIRKMAEQLKSEFKNRLEILTNRDELDENLRNIERALSDEFWRSTSSDQQGAIEFLDTKLAPLLDENEGYMLSYLGTDLHAFAENFDRFEIVQGRMTPQGQRGILLAEKFYNDAIQNRVAMMFDSINQDIHERAKTIASDPIVKNRAERMPRQYRAITFQLEPAQAEILLGKLEKFLPGEKGDLDRMVQSFLTVNDENFDKRYKFFLDEIAPMIRRYLFDIGDEITIRTYTKSGYLRSINIKVYGTFRFKGLEKSELAGAYNLLDMLTFRDLYGMMTTEKRQELESIQRAVGVEDVRADEAEAALFSGNAEIEKEKEGGEGFDEFAGVNLKKETAGGQVRLFDQRDIDNGVALNAAVILKSQEELEQTRIAIERVLAAQGLNLQVVDWQKAAGMIGQAVVLVRVILYVAIFAIFLVALVIINNTMIMATMERTMEIGTMRAIGGQARFVLWLFMLETGLLGIIAGLIGSLCGTALVRHLGKTGIPAVEDVLVLLFSGPRLYPEVGPANLLGAWAVIVLVILAASFYPALAATRIQPVVAMQARE